MALKPAGPSVNRTSSSLIASPGADIPEACSSGRVLEQRPGSGGDMQIEPLLDVGEVDVGDLADALQPIAHGAPVDRQRIGGVVVAPTAFEISRQCLGELGVVFLVVVEQGAEPLPDERLNLLLAVASREESVEPELAVRGHAVRVAGMLPYSEGAGRFSPRPGELGDAGADPPDADRRDGVRQPSAHP